MTSLQDHIEHVECHSFDDVAALALVDRMQEEWSLSRIAALRRVAKIRRPNRQARYIQSAAAVMRRESRSALLARDHCFFGAVKQHTGALVLIFVTGFRSPKAGARTNELPHRFPPGLLVSVGAREYLRLHKAYLKSLRSIGQQHRFRG